MLEKLSDDALHALAAGRAAIELRRHPRERWIGPGWDQYADEYRRRYKDEAVEMLSKAICAGREELAAVQRGNAEALRRMGP